MKFRMKLRFQGPPLELEHQLTALQDSDSITMGWLQNLSHSREIWMALWIARTSAKFISFGGIGHENIHKNSPLAFRKTPPIAERDNTRL